MPADKNIFNRYYEADFVGLFSHYEGFPNTICEAMAIGKPVLVSNVSDIPLFVKDSDNGFIFNSKDVHSIANALIKAIDSSTKVREEIGVKNTIIVNKHFNKEAIVDSYLDLLK
jgi:glycosyltransferase involved in cell wall biosynthesis